MPLPDVEPVDADAIKAWLNIDDTDDDDHLGVVVPAVCAFIRGLPVAQASNTDPAPDAWPSTIRFGAIMLGARLLRRRGSPEGVATFGDQGPVYVQRNDPDVALMLKLGAHKRPAVG